MPVKLQSKLGFLRRFRMRLLEVTVKEFTMCDLLKAFCIFTRAIFEVLKFDQDLRELRTCEHPQKLWLVLTGFGNLDTDSVAWIMLQQVEIAFGNGFGGYLIQVCVKFWYFFSIKFMVIDLLTRNWRTLFNIMLFPSIKNPINPQLRPKPAPRHALILIKERLLINLRQLKALPHDAFLAH